VGAVSGGSGWQRAAPKTVLAVAAVVATVVILRAGRGLTFFYDEWSWIQDRRTGSIDDYLESHNGHLGAFAVAVYKAMFSAFGLTDYAPYRVLAVVLHLACCALLYLYLRRRAPEWFAVAATVVLLFLGYAWQDLLWPFQIQFFGSIAGGLAALILIDRDDRIGNLGAALALVVALGSSGVGVVFAGAVLFELALRRDSWKRLWVPLGPMALYGVWYLAYGTSQAQRSNVDDVPGYTARAGSAAVGALAGTTMDNGKILFGALAAGVLFFLARRGSVPPRLATVLVLGLGYWAITGLGRAQFNEPDASRYLDPGAVMVVLVLAELVRELRTPRRAWAVALIAALAFGVAFSIRGNLRQLDAGAAGLRGVSEIVRAELAALELVRDRVDPGFRPDAEYMPPVLAGPYFDAVDDLGSPALSPRELRRASEALRTRADGVLARALGATLTPVEPDARPPSGALTVVRSDGGDVTSEDACVVLTPRGGAASLDVEGERLRIRVDAAPGIAADVAVRNLGTVDAAGLGSVAPDSSAVLTLPRVPTGPWQVQVVSQGPVRVCPVA
jgi:hypothetical protein